MNYIFIFVFGLMIGSFLGAVTHRLPMGISISKGRSLCPKCGKKISWYDNIPLLSYFILKAKCRNCGKKISFRYPAIEFSTGAVFLVLYHLVENCQVFSGPVCEWQNGLGALTLPFFLVIAAALIAIFVIDIEHQLILDEIIFGIFIVTFFAFLASGRDDLYLNLLAAFIGSTAFLALHVVTRGRGMGLGDVKFSLLPGIILGYSYTAIYFITSFVIGGLVGLVLIGLGKASFGKKIAFGPFLVIGFFVVFIFGQFLKNTIFIFE